MIKLVAFDLDGTIGDTIPMCLKALKKAVTPYVTMAFLCRKQRKKNKHQSTKKGNDMEFVGIEKQLFEELVRKFEYFEHRVMEICNRENDRTLHKWMDNQDVCRYLNISPRTLQTLRDNGTLPFSQINHKIFYKPEDVQGIVKKVEDRRKEALYRGRNI